MGQKFELRDPDTLETWMEPPEDWQFENSKPIKITGRKPMEIPKLNLAEILPQNKEVDNMRFTELKMDKQIRLVAEEYNKGLSPSAIRRKLGIKGAGTYYDRLDKAKAMGLVAETKKDAGGTPGVEVQEVPANFVKGEMIVPPKATVEDFAKVASEKLELAEKLAKEADLLQQAGTIAQALTELLGDRAGDLVDGLYSKVSA